MANRELLRKFLSADGVVSSEKRWWSGSVGFDFKDDSADGKNAVKKFESVRRRMTSYVCIRNQQHSRLILRIESIDFSTSSRCP
jgi:hypothetical protein